MKKRKLKPYVKNTLLMAVLIIGLMAVLPLINNKTKSVSKENDNFIYVNDYIFDNYYPVVNTEEKFQKPYSNEKVEVYKKFYDKDASEEEQKNSIVYHEGIYMQNTGVTYKSDESFDVLSSISGTVSEVTDDTLLGKTIEIRNANEIVTVYQSLSEVLVKKGDTVTTGQMIAKSGTCSLYPEIKNAMHFELYKNGVVLNPEKYYDKQIKELENN